MNRNDDPKERAKKLIEKMTLEEKVTMVFILHQLLIEFYELL